MVNCLKSNIVHWADGLTTHKMRSLLALQKTNAFAFYWAKMLTALGYIMAFKWVSVVMRRSHSTISNFPCAFIFKGSIFDPRIFLFLFFGLDKLGVLLFCGRDGKSYKFILAFPENWHLIVTD
jgi:hypothetical protein